jgi:myo-inositol-1(or 4)-monophosphatase
MRVQELRKAGKEIFERLKTIRIKGEAPGEKGAGGDRTYPVDKISEDMILKRLEQTGEALSVITEEAGIIKLSGGGGRLAVIDPIDGSRNAVAGIPFYGASIAIAAGGTMGAVETGYVINLVTGEEFWAEKGKGAHMGRVGSKNIEQISTQKDDILKLVAFEAQSPKMDFKRMLPLLMAGRKTRCLGAVALDLAYLASGAISVFANAARSRSFDFAAGYILLKEAGGIFTDLEGKSLERQNLGLEKGATLLAAANPALHKKALKLLND